MNPGRPFLLASEGSGPFSKDLDAAVARQRSASLRMWIASFRLYTGGFDDWPPFVVVGLDEPAEVLR